MKRNEVLLASAKKTGLGLEVGPSHRPAAPKREGFNVEIIDHLSREGLIEKYRDHNLDLDAIEEVDHIWTGQSYEELTGNSKHYDWIIASHLIEHTPDLIGFLKQCDQVLKDDGVVSLAIPDKRYCFDHHRPISGVGKVIDAHLNENTINSPGTVAEYFLNVVKKDGIGAWNESTTGECDFIHTLDQAIDGMNKVRNHKVYIDCHVWCFVPHSFRLLMHDLHALGLVPFKEVSFSQTTGCEFFMTLGREGQGMDVSRIEAARAVELELAEPVRKAA